MRRKDTLLTIALFADTHIRPSGSDSQAAYPSDAEHTARAQRAVEMINEREPCCAVHLGDMTHTVPGLGSQGDAWDSAEEVLSALSCPVHFVAGNHDVGDKPDSHATAPKVDRASCETFERRFGSSYHCWDVGEHRFVALNASLINSGGQRELQQKSWLDKVLSTPRRTFLFLHYPPFLLSPGEPSHYDNIAEPGRSWLLSLIRDAAVEAVFSGHVHNFFYSRLERTSFYSLPSTAFVRPEYSELFPASPADENGRNDKAKLGFMLLHIQEEGHRLELVRTFAPLLSKPPRRAALGLWLRRGLCREAELPCGDLDEFRPKRARNDYPLLALIELGIKRVRLPLADLEAPASRKRAEELRALGIELLVFSVGEPQEQQADLVRQVAPLLCGWEVILGPEDRLAWHERLGEPAVPLAQSKIAQRGCPSTGYLSHFPRQGYSPEDQDLKQDRSANPEAQYLSFRVPQDVAPRDGISAAVARAEQLGVRALCHIELPEGDELHIHDNDQAVAHRVLDAEAAAQKHPTALVFLDLFEDKDRGYYPRHGLIDRRGNPRLAAQLLRRELSK